MLTVKGDYYEKKSLSVIVVLASIIFSTQAIAHTLWINLYESFAHPPKHAILSLGWGHVVPMIENFNSNSFFAKLAGFILAWCWPNGNGQFQRGLLCGRRPDT
ncbi:MAG: hypothetical protein LWW98_12010 [Deltaproteobacteria bacterium]|nr:hypothetical protein [Deltaproteobacteria bacterium]